MSAHTPGPWHDVGFGWISAGDDVEPERGSTIARYDWETPSGIANARLIAAAPDLLEALHQSEAELQSLRTPSVADGIDHTLRIIRAAIAKATGES